MSNRTALLLYPTASELNALQADAAAAHRLEALAKAQHDTEFLISDLQAALRGSSALAALALLPLIRQARELRDGIAAVELAMRDPT